MAALDTRYHNTRIGETGPLVTWLDSHGRLLTWVVGAWQEASQDLHNLLELIPRCKL